MNNRAPKYQLLVDWIKEQIASGSVKRGEKLHSENQLCEMFGISRQTVRQALGLLEAEGFLERRRGSGTFIRRERRSHESRTIGVISTYTDDYIFPSIIRGIESVLMREHYAMQLSFTHNRVENELLAVRQMIAGGVDGIIVEPTKSSLPNPNIALYEEAQAAGIAVLFFNARYPSLPFPCVCLDDRAAGREATRYLIGRGHRNIAGIFLSDDQQGHLRYAGYLDALLEARLPLNAERLLWYATEDAPTLFCDVDRILGRLEDSTAVLCYNDQIAAQLSLFLNANGLHIPADISLISVDNSNIAAYCEPPLTSIDHPKEELGRTAAENILHLIRTPSFNANVSFPPVTEERQSVDAPRNS